MTHQTQCNIHGTVWESDDSNGCDDCITDWQPIEHDEDDNPDSKE